MSSYIQMNFDFNPVEFDGVTAESTYHAQYCPADNAHLKRLALTAQKLAEIER